MEMFNIMKGMDKIRQKCSSAESTVIEPTKGCSLRIMKSRIKMIVRQRSFTQRVVNAWNGFPLKVVAAETVDRFKLELDGYFDTLEIEGYSDIGRTCR